MLSYFPEIYPNEYLYSVILRYDKHSGNNDLRKSFQDLFGSNRASNYQEKIHFFDYNLENIISASMIELLFENTNLKQYIPFMNFTVGFNVNLKYIFTFIYPPTINKTILNIESSVSSVPYLKYCQECYKEDIYKYGEGYFHLEHQYEGNFFCKKHNSVLKISLPIQRHGVFPSFDLNPIVSKDLQIKSDKAYLELAQLSIDIKASANNCFYCRDILKEIKSYKEILIKGEYGYKVSKNIKQEILYNDFVGFYTNESLELLDIYPKIESEYNWLKEITRNQLYTHKLKLSPIHHLMFIRFLKYIRKNKKLSQKEKKLFSLIS